jgi:hypothetical protein
MKILFWGSFKYNPVGEPNIKECLEEMGHKVDVIERFLLPKEIKKIIKKEKYDLFLCSKIQLDDNIQDIWKEIKSPKITWLFDLYFGL